ncbi:hypothetical protein SSYRP_v1c07640 [Spiroplasma syrphidicola EA-1]|uniref:ECF transporter S component n=2 Tax=Spiroplasma syrphidicola TaxID=216945 RepID=R4UEK0_9MOLU|nr:hypothetical protein SSYRP_v1c07640 [Spiroplasma syrphidicola EA-1]
MRKLTTRVITINSILIAIFLLFTFVPQLGYIMIGPVALTLVHILFLIGMYALFLTAGVNLIISGTIYGLIFGLSSLIKILVFPDITAFIFVNPLFSVVPRLLMGIIVGTLAHLLNYSAVKREQKALNNQLAKVTWLTRYSYKVYDVIVAATATILNTFFVLSFMYFLGPLIYTNPDQQSFFKAFTWIILATNFLPEWLLAILIYPPVAYALRKLYY